jgi:FAD binding domain
MTEKQSLGRGTLFKRKSQLRQFPTCVPFLLWLDTPVLFLTVSSSPQPNGRTLGQSTTEAILRSHLSRLDVTVELGTELVDFTQDTHKVTANLLKRDKSGSSQNETLEVDWVIGADGARGYFFCSLYLMRYLQLIRRSNKGITQKHLGINFWRETLEKQAFLVVDVEMEGLDRQSSGEVSAHTCTVDR